MRAPRTAIRPLTLLTTGLLATALTACGVGLDPQTYRERTTHDASNTTVGDLALRNVGIEPPETGAGELAVGKDANVTLAVVSVSEQADTLLSVSTAAASSVGLVDGSGHAVASVTVPALGSVAAGDFGVVLRGLTKPLRPGMYIDMTFAFEKNGRATFAVPVRLYTEPVPRASYEPKHAEE
ncbi:MAG: copper chaperone PCu(A)C [Frankiaceae bacterium]|nr:copper chaperone PCu(A)C [Frankiaceae bacterium]